VAAICRVYGPKLDIQIRDDDLKIDTMRAQGAGGQHDVDGRQFPASPAVDGEHAEDDQL